MPDIYIGEAKTNDLTIPSAPDNLGINESKKEILKIEHKKNKEHNHLHTFAAYCENPSSITFADRLDDEEILLLLRKHFVTNIPWVIKAVALSLVPLIIMMVIFFEFISIDFLPPNYAVISLLFYYFIVFGYVFVNYLTWFYNVSLVTNERIVDVDFSQIVFENVAATKLTQVEDVHYSQIGVIRSIFDYGDVILQTAGTLPNFDFLAVPHPERVIKVIGALIGNAENA